MEIQREHKMINDVSGAFTRWLEPIAINRIGQGSYVDGDWVDGVSATVNILAVVQNANADDLELLPEGTRTSEAIKIHTVAKVKTVSEDGETNADTFPYDGDTYRLYAVNKRKIGNYFKAVGTRIKT